MLDIDRSVKSIHLSTEPENGHSTLSQPQNFQETLTVYSEDEEKFKSDLEVQKLSKQDSNNSNMEREQTPVQNQSPDHVAIETEDDNKMQEEIPENAPNAEMDQEVVVGSDYPETQESGLKSVTGSLVNSFQTFELANIEPNLDTRIQEEVQTSNVSFPEDANKENQQSQQNYSKPDDSS